MKAPTLFTLLVTSVISTACGDATDPGPVGATRLDAVTPTSVIGPAGAEVTPSPTVRVTDGSGNPLQGVQVLFEFFGGSTGPEFIGVVAAMTGADGTASVSWRLSTSVGVCGVRAKATGLDAVIFTGTVQAGPVAHLQALVAEQTAVAGAQLATPLAVRASDEFGNLVPGADVTFRVVSGGGSLESETAVTNAQGVAASGTWTLGPVPGEQRVLATSGSAEVGFRAIALTPCELDCPPPGELAFVRGDQIFRVRTDGSGLVQLTNGGINREPAWSPDGQRIAFVSERDGASYIYVMNADGSGVAQRTNGGRDASPAWSPDGRRIAFSSLRDGNSGIYVMRVDEDWSKVAHLGFGPGFNGYPAWSPDGSRIAFVSDWRAFDFVYDLYVMNEDGSDVRPVLPSPFPSVEGVDYFQPAWSPDGTIAVAGCPRAWDLCYQSSMIALVSPDGSGFRIVAQAGGYSRPTWSPDGSVIAFGVSSCRNCALAIHYVRRDGTGGGVLIWDGHSPAWRPRQ